MRTEGEQPSDVASGVERSAQWIYTGIWRVLVQWFRVPEEPPSLPVAPGESMETFKPARGFLKYLKFWFWISLLVVDIAIFIFWIVITIAVWWLGLLLFPVAVGLAVLPDILVFIGLHLRYDTTWYVMTERSLRIRRGIWIIHEMTITFENVQNVRVNQGPVQRYFGIANLILETAGAGGGDSSRGGFGIANRGVIEGVADAQRLRDMILPRLRRSRTAGLGDDEPVFAPPAAWSKEHLTVLREIRDEIKGSSLEI